MAIVFRTYVPEPRFGEDYARQRDFLIRLDSSNYSIGWRPYATSAWWSREK